MKGLRKLYSALWTQQVKRMLRGESIAGWERACRELYSIVAKPVLLDSVGDLLGATILLWDMHFFCKMPADDRLIHWHQDASYWKITDRAPIRVENRTALCRLATDYSPIPSKTRSARTASAVEIVTPKAWRVLRLRANSILLIPSTGRSTGRAPRRIFATNRAACTASA